MSIRVFRPTVFAGVALLLVLAGGTLQAALSLPVLVRTLELRALTEADLVEQIRISGVDFSLTPEITEQLRKAGATAAVLAAIGGTPTPPTPAAPSAAPAPAPSSSGWVRIGSAPTPLTVRPSEPPTSWSTSQLADLAERATGNCDFVQSMEFARQLRAADPNHPWLRTRLEAVRDDGRRYVAAQEALLSVQSLLSGTPTEERIRQAIVQAQRAQQLAPSCMSEQVAAINGSIQQVSLALRSRRGSGDWGESLRGFMEGASMAASSMSRSGYGGSSGASGFGQTATGLGPTGQVTGTGRNGQAGFADFLGVMSRSIDAMSAYRVNPQAADQNFAGVLGTVAGIDPRTGRPVDAGAGGYNSPGLGDRRESIQEIMDRYRTPHSPPTPQNTPGANFDGGYRAAGGVVGSDVRSREAAPVGTFSSTQDTIDRLFGSGPQRQPTLQQQQQSRPGVNYDGGYRAAGGVVGSDAPSREAAPVGTFGSTQDTIDRLFGNRPDGSAPAQTSWPRAGFSGAPPAASSNLPKIEVAVEPTQVRAGDTVRLILRYMPISPPGQLFRARETRRIVHGGQVIGSMTHDVQRPEGLVTSEQSMRIPVNAPAGLYSYDAEVQGHGLLQQGSANFTVVR